MKTLITILLLGISFTMHAQSCFSDKSDVMSYAIYKTFESEDGAIKITFGPSEAILYAGSSTFRYMYENWSYMGSGYKGSVTMMELSGEGGLELFISCKERMMTDGETLLYEEGANPGSNSASSSNSSSVNSVKIGNLEVMTEDLGEMEWEDAKKACANLGDGWRLPTLDEAREVFYQNSEKIGGFKYSLYWSSDEKDATLAFTCDVQYGGWTFSTKTDTCSVRAVRDL